MPTYDKRQRSGIYGIKTTLIGSISWQWLFATNLLVAYELTLTTKDTPLSPNRYSWLPLETFIAVGWLLKSYWNPDSPLFKPIKNQSTSMLTQEGYTFAITTIMSGSEKERKQGQASESSGQVPKVASQTTSAFTTPPYSGSGEGNGDSQQYSHTLGLNCFFYPCRGVCRFSRSSDNTHSLIAGTAYACPIEPLNDEAPMTGNLPASSNDLVIIQGLLSLQKDKSHEETQVSSMSAHSTSPMGSSETQQATGSFQWTQRSPHLYRTDIRQTTGHIEKRICEVPLSGGNGQQQPCGMVCQNAPALSVHKSRYHSGQRICDVILVEENGLQRTCGRTCRNTLALSVHKSRYHSGQRICDAIVVREDAEEGQCGKVCYNAQVLSDHKKRDHTGQQICDTTVVGENGQLRQCGKACKNIKAMWSHKNSAHTGQQICKVTVVGEDGQQWSCGKVCKSSKALSDHKTKYHGQKTCDVAIVRERGRQRPCGTVCKNAQVLSHHKRMEHTGQSTCVVITVGENGQLQPCKATFENKQGLLDHKRKYHNGQQICDVSFVKEDGQPHPCGKVFKTTQALSGHKRVHRKRKPADVEQADNLYLPKKGKANN